VIALKTYSGEQRKKMDAATLQLFHLSPLFMSQTMADIDSPTIKWRDMWTNRKRPKPANWPMEFIGLRGNVTLIR
jgi:hypothetical protein